MNLEYLIKKIDHLESKIDQLNYIKKKILTFEEAAKYLGCSQSHLYKLTSKLLIPHYKPNGKIIYFKRSEIEKWVTSEKVI